MSSDTTCVVLQAINYLTCFILPFVYNTTAVLPEVCVVWGGVVCVCEHHVHDCVGFVGCVRSLVMFRLFGNYVCDSLC